MKDYLNFLFSYGPLIGIVTLFYIIIGVSTFLVSIKNWRKKILPFVIIFFLIVSFQLSNPSPGKANVVRWVFLFSPFLAISVTTIFEYLTKLKYGQVIVIFCLILIFVSFVIVFNIYEKSEPYPEVKVMSWLKENRNISGNVLSLCREDICSGILNKNCIADEPVHPYVWPNESWYLKSVQLVDEIKDFLNEKLSKEEFKNFVSKYDIQYIYICKKFQINYSENEDFKIIYQSGYDKIIEIYS